MEKVKKTQLDEHTVDPLQRMPDPVLLPPPHRSTLEPEINFQGNSSMVPRTVSKSEKDYGTIGVVSPLSMEEMLCVESEDPRETTQACHCCRHPLTSQWDSSWVP